MSPLFEVVIVDLGRCWTLIGCRDGWVTKAYHIAAQAPADGTTDGPADGPSDQYVDSLSLKGRRWPRDLPSQYSDSLSLSFCGLLRSISVNESEFGRCDSVMVLQSTTVFTALLELDPRGHAARAGC